MKKEKIQQFLSFLTCLLLIAAISIRRDGKVLGHEIRPADKAQMAQMAQMAETAETESISSNDTLRTLSDGTVVINTRQLGKDIIGYSGTVPLEISLKDGKVKEVKVLENTETPGFLRKAGRLLSRWDGLSIAQAQELEVDVVSGATYTSNAIIDNMQRGLSFAAKNEKKHSLWEDFDLSAKALAGLIVALMAAILPLFIKNRRYRIVQQVLNVGVLGFWCGSFINYTTLISYMSNGMNLVALLVPLILLITAFIYPLFGKKNFYCAHVCPFGSLQELAGRCTSYKINLSQKTLKRLYLLREGLWAVLTLCLLTGIWFDWIDYEPFSAFIFQSASWTVIALAIVFVVLSPFTLRPYCRFVCPTGTLFKFAQSSFKIGKC